MSEAMIRLSVFEFFSRYCHSIDHHDREGLTSRFAESAAFTIKGSDDEVMHELKGREEIIDFIASHWPDHTEQPRHLIQNLVFDEVTDDSVHVRAYLHLTFSGPDGVRSESTGDYESRLVSRDGDWKLISHMLRID